MGRYTGPVCRLCRRSGEKLFLKGDRCLTPKCAIERRSGPPGQQSARRRRQSERGVQLREKQKARQTYGVLEHQFRRYYEKALARPGITGQVLLQLLERRLDNVVYRLGFSGSRNQARQLISHGHITVNGRKTNIPSYTTRVGDQIAWKASTQQREFFQQIAEEARSKAPPTWLTLDRQSMSGQVAALPQPQDIDTKIAERLIVEYYSR